jgi:hypothetical protein
MDNKPVHMLSTFATFITSVERIVKSTKRAFLGYASIIIPNVVKIYNKFMGGTDSFDQRLVYYKTRVRSKRWPVIIFTHFLEAAVVDSYILHRDSKKLVRGNQGYNLLSFYEMLIDQLATPCLRKGGRPGISIKESRQEDEDKAKRYIGRHKIYFERRSAKESITRRRCRVCHQQTQSGCKTCDVGLCVFSDRLSSNADDDCCFDKYHDPETPNLYD